MLTYSERVILRESTAQKREAVAAYIQCGAEEFSQAVQSQLPTSISQRSGMEIQLCRLAQLYVLDNEDSYAEKIYDALIKFANNHFEIKEGASLYSIGSDYSGVQPVYPAIAYSLLADYSTDSFDEKYGIDTRELIESWLYDTAELTYNYFVVKTTGNLTGYTVKHMAGLAVVLNNPLVMRWTIFIADKLMDPEMWLADGMWWEGSISYCTQTYGNLSEALPVIGRFKDPEGYEDKLLGLKLEGKSISSRYPMIQYASQAMGKLVNPDGTRITVHDTHASYNSVVGENLPIKENYLNNAEFNHFGLFALKTGDTNNAQQISLLFPPILSGMPFGGGHYHGNFLTMTLWAGGQDLLPDAGYPFQVSNHRYFHMSPVAHNGSWIYNNSANNYSNYSNKSSRSNLLRYDDGTGSDGNIQLIEAQQLMAEIMGIKDKRRLLMLIKTSQNTSYVFDLQNLKGGDVHENFLRGSEDEDITVSTDAQRTGTASNLGTYLKNGGKKGLMANETLFTDADIYSGDNGIDFSFIGDSGATLNAFIKGTESTMVAFSSMPSLRRTGGSPALRDDFPTKHFYQRREVSENELTRFAGVYEGMASGDEAKVQSVEWRETDNAVFAVVNLGDYEDVICISDDFNEKKYAGIIFKTNIGWVRREKSTGKVENGYIYGGGEILTSSGKFSCKEDFVTDVVDTDRSLFGENSLVLADEVPDDLVGKWGNVTFSDGSGLSHKITDVSGSTAKINNDAGFELGNGVSRFTSFPAKQNSSGSLWMGTVEHSSLSDRTVSGTVKYTAGYSYYGKPDKMETTIVVLENGSTFKSLKPNATYSISAMPATDYILFVAIFRCRDGEKERLISAYTAYGGDSVEFKSSNNWFAYLEDGSAPELQIECMVWNRALSQLCDAVILNGG